MGDDGVGLRVIEKILERKLDQGFQVIDIADNGIKLLSYFTEETEKILLIDCVEAEKKPGDFVLFSPKDVESEKMLSGMTTHEGDVLKLIELAKAVNYPIPPLRVLGIQPESVVPSMELSDLLASRLDEYVKIALAELNKDWK